MNKRIKKKYMKKQLYRNAWLLSIMEEQLTNTRLGLNVPDKFDFVKELQLAESHRKEYIKRVNEVINDILKNTDDTRLGYFPEPVTWLEELLTKTPPLVFDETLNTERKS